MTVVQDLRYAARALRQSPGFTAAAVITLALGVGAKHRRLRRRERRDASAAAIRGGRSARPCLGEQHFRLILGRGVALALVGAAFGVGGAFWLTRAMRSLLFSVSATDPGTFVAVPLLLIFTAAVACYVPARRAMRVDPVTALRAD